MEKKMVSSEARDLIAKSNNTANIMRGIILSLLIILLALFSEGCGLCTISPLNQAAWDNDLNRIETLLEEGAPIDEGGASPRGVCMGSPLDSAVVQGNIEAVELLLERGADVNLPRYCSVDTTYGYYSFKGSALMLSSLKGDDQITEMLLKAGADVNQLTQSHLWTMDFLDGYDSLDYSADMGNSDIARLLIKYGADVNNKNEEGRKAVYIALIKGHIDYIITLLENGLEIESDPKYMHYNAELANLAADFYAQTDEEKSLQFYKLAIELYPGGAKNYKSIATGKWLKEVGKTMLAALATELNRYAGSQGINTSGSFVGSNMYIYKVHNYDPSWTENEFYKQKAIQSGENQTLCQKIVSCYEENKPNIALVDCVKKTYEKEEEVLPIK